MGQVSRLDRWAAFNAVGLIGIVVQLGVLALLVRGCRIHYLAATAIAVEAAVLHNFLWHQHWTWRDRAATGCGPLLARLGRFHLLNGGISLAGNLILMGILTGLCALEPVMANLVAVSACSLITFAASDRIVFMGAAPRALLLAGLVVAGAPGSASAGSPAEATLTGWKAYEQRVEERYRGTTIGQARFFTRDQFRLAADWRQAVLTGGVALHELEAPAPGAASIQVPGGRVHHWVGAVFVPGTTVEAVLARLERSAGREADLYEDVIASKLIGRDREQLRVFMKLRRASIITVTYNTEHAVEYRRHGAARGSSRSIATRIAELADPGTLAEREKPAGSDHGFLWRLNTYWRYEQTSDGVMIECESLSLSRSIPRLVGPIVAPLVDRIARESLERTLRAVRAALAGPTGL